MNPALEFLISTLRKPAVALILSAAAIALAQLRADGASRGLPQPSADGASRGLPILTLAQAPPKAGSEFPANQRLTAEPLTAWRFYQETTPPREAQANLYDFVLTPSVFDAARLDLADLRLYDSASREVPYALRVRRPQDVSQPIEAREFNRARGPEGSSELYLDLGPDRIEHNEVEVNLPGARYRRRAELEGSLDQNRWSTLTDDYLIHWQVGQKELQDRTLTYAPSRFRYLRLRVHQDPEVDREPIEILAATVRRRVEQPGEYVAYPTRLGQREPVRADGVAGSAWVVDLGGDSVPCERISVEITDREFVRNFHIEAGGQPGSDEPFRRIAGGLWRRRAGEPPQPMTAEFPEVRAARLRLMVADHRNPPLDIRAVEVSSPARVVIYAHNERLAAPVRLYYGNPNAEAAHYDFARILPRKLDPAPARRSLGPRQENPVYTPEPLPLTERWPWLVYLLLGAAVAVLGGLIANLARAAVALSDARQTSTAAHST